MSKQEQINALLGSQKGGPGGKGEEASVEELRRELASAKVEQGRVRTLDARVKELERENAALREKRGAKAIIESLSQEDRGDVPDEYLESFARVANKATAGVLAGVNEQLAELRKDREAEKVAAAEKAAEELLAKIDRKYPNFRASIGPGGDKATAWTSFLVHNSASVQDAFTRSDFDSLAYHIDRFYREVLDIAPPSGSGKEAAVSDPLPSGGMPEVVIDHSKKTYTQKEYSDLEEKAMKLRRAGKFKEYAELSDELDTILAEGRISG